MTTSRDIEPVAYPFNHEAGLGLHESYAAAREATGLTRVRMPYGEPAWLVTRHADAKLVLGDPRFSRAMSVERDEPRMSPVKVYSGLLAMDPPEHTRLRRLVAKAFTQRRVETLRPRVRQLAEGLVGDLVASGAPVDLVENFALSLPVAVICELLGIPTADRVLFRVWTDNALSTNNLTAEQHLASHQEFRAYLSGLIEQRRAEPADDLMSALIAARDEHDRLSELELIDMVGVILLAGHETTATQIPNFVQVLLENRELWDDLCEHPERIPAAVEELVRFVPLGAGAGFARYATEDVEVGGELVRAGEPLLVAIHAANRDERRFEAPEKLSFDRTENPHIAYGHGAHHCMGAQLARLELCEAMLALTSRLPGLHLAGEITWKTQMVVRGPSRMLVAW